MQFVCYYTTDPHYSGDERLLRACLESFGLPLYSEAIPPDRWQAATQYKARFMRGCLDRFKGQRLCYVDVDTLITRRPSLLLESGADIAASSLGTELLSGVVVFGGGHKCVEVVDRWIALNELYPERLPDGRLAWDQRTLAMAIRQTDGVVFEALPPEYCWIPVVTAKWHPDVRPVMVSTRGSFRVNPEHR